MQVSDSSEGSDSCDVIAGIVRADTSIAALAFHPIERPPRTKNRLDGNRLYARYEPEALRLRKEYNVPFWMAVNLVMEKEGEPIPSEVIEAASLHQSIDDTKILRMARDDVSPESIRIMASTGESAIFAVLSTVAVGNQSAGTHIPMLDFRVSPSASSEVSATRVLSHLGVPGYLLDSGNSYHFFGSQLMTTDQLITFLAEAALFAPVLDHRWIAHQIIERRCALRLSANTHNGAYPTVVREIP